jgi:hypothetical protein
MLGRAVAELVNQDQAAGNYSATWDASRMESGVYVYTLQAGEFHATKRMILMR